MPRSSKVNKPKKPSLPTKKHLASHQEMQDREPNSDEETPSSSQSSPVSPQRTSVEELMSNMVDAQRSKHNTRKKNVLNEYTNACSTLQSDMNTLFDGHEERSTTLHTTHLTHLHTLLSRKAKIEQEMRDRLAELRKAYAAHSEDLERVVAKRVGELEMKREG